MKKKFFFYFLSPKVDIAVFSCIVDNCYTFFSFDGKSQVHMHYAAKYQNPILRVVSPVFAYRHFTCT